MNTDDLDGGVEAIAALGDPRRRFLYRFVAGQGRAVGRHEAAEAAGVSRSAAAFHLDRLVDDGLLDTEFRRLSGRQGPGAGRPSKLYRRATGDIAVSLPARHYDLVADLLAGAVTSAAADSEPVEVVLHRLARERGAALAASAPVAATAEDAARSLARHGYEPRVEDDEIVLANCPFRALAARHAELVCGMNLALLEGFAAALPRATMAARLQPSDRGCCVRLAVGPSALRP